MIRYLMLYDFLSFNCMFHIQMKILHCDKRELKKKYVRLSEHVTCGLTKCVCISNIRRISTPNIKLNYSTKNYSQSLQKKKRYSNYLKIACARTFETLNHATFSILFNTCITARQKECFILWNANLSILHSFERNNM